jgi:hypothetical protein
MSVRWRAALDWLFAGDRRVWLAAAGVGVPLAALIGVWCAIPRDYYTGTNSVAVYTYVAQVPPGESMCLGGLNLPAGTARLKLTLISRTRVRPPLRFTLTLGNRVLPVTLPSQPVPPDRISAALVPVPQLGPRPFYVPASLCASAADLVNWGGVPVSAGQAPPPTIAGQPLSTRVAVFYLPRTGSKRSYLAQAGSAFRRAALLRPGFVEPWLYGLLFFVLLPLLAWGSIRLLALAVAGRTGRFGLAMFLVAALTAMSWSLITPAFQAPDEVDHFAYVSSLAERGVGPDRTLGTRSAWSSAENLAIGASASRTINVPGGGRPPWLSVDEKNWLATARALRPSSGDGGGYSAAGSSHGPLYYMALAPAYLLAGNSVFEQLGWTRLVSALIGALTALFAYLLMLEFAPQRRWLAVIAGLLVAFQPMYGFISGTVNNDVGADAVGAALTLLLVRLVRRGPTIGGATLTGALLMLAPVVKGSGYFFIPVAGLAVLLALWRRHRRADLPAWAVLSAAAAAAQVLWARASGLFHRTVFTTPGGGSPTGAEPVFSSYLAYLWQVFFPRLGFMAPHFANGPPAYTIFVERGWGAFGFYTVYFPGWVYDVIEVLMFAVLLLALIACVREWPFLRRNLASIAVLVFVPIAVVAGVEAVYYTSGVRSQVAEFGRYAFPALAALAVLVTASLHAFGRRVLPLVGAGLVAAMIALSYAGQLLELTRFYT